MYSETRLIIKPIDHTNGGAQLDVNDAYVYHTSSLSLSTEGRTSAAQLTGEIPVVGEMMPQIGSMCILEATNEEGEFVRVFVGFIFTYSVDRWGVVSFTAFDAIRYLQNPASGKWLGNKNDISQIIKDIVVSCGLPAMAEQMELEHVGVTPTYKLIKISEKGIDIIDELLEWAQIKATANENGVKTKGGDAYAATRPAERWVFVDHCGKFILCTANQLSQKILGVTEPPVIGTGCAVTEFSMSVNIDDSANTVRLLRASETGLSGWVAEDEECIKKWGPVTYFEKIDNAYLRSDDQMKLRAAIELCSRDAEKRSLNITTLGITGLRSGMMVRINIPWLEKYFGEICKSKLMYLDSVSHSWEEGTHTMSLSAEVLPGDVNLDAWKDKTFKLKRTKLDAK